MHHTICDLDCTKGIYIFKGFDITYIQSIYVRMKYMHKRKQHN